MIYGKNRRGICFVFFALAAAVAFGEDSPSVRETIEMDEIEVVAESDGDVAPAAVKAVRAKQVDDMPTGGDPFSVVQYQDAVVDDAVLVDDGYSAVDTVGSFTRKNRSFSVYGADSDFNSYWFDFIRIPMNKHSESDAPVIPVWAIDRIDIWKGIAPLESGPGIGGTFKAVPVNDFGIGSAFTLAPNSDLVNFTWKRGIDDRSGFLLSVSKSLTEITSPLAFKVIDILYTAIGMDIIEDTAVMVPSFGDICASLTLSDTSQSLVVDALGFYDFVQGGLDLVGTWDVTANAFPVFGSFGAKWSLFPDAFLENSVYAYSTYQHRQAKSTMNLDVVDYMTQAWRAMGLSDEDIATAFATLGDSYSGTAVGGENPLIDVWTAEAGDSLRLFPVDGLSFDLGAQARYASYSGGYDGFRHFDLVLMGVTMSDHYDVDSISVSGNVLRLYGYGKAGYDFPSISLTAGGGCAWYPFDQAAYPSIEVSGVLNDVDDFGFSFRGGWSSASFEEYAFAERRLSEKILGTPSSSAWAHLPMAVTGNATGSFVPWKSSTVSVEPYAAFYYDLSGLALYLSWKDPYSVDATGDKLRDLESLDPDIGRSIGMTMTCDSVLSERWKLKGAYTIASTEYRQRGSEVWFRSNNDVRHTLKGSLAFERDGFLAACTLNLYADKPFTSETAVAPEVLRKDSFNAAVDLIPRFSTGINLQWDSTWLFGLKGRYEFNCANILAFLNPTLKGMKAELKGVTGSTTAAFGSREYSWLRTDLIELLGAMKIKFGGTYFF